MLAKSPQQHSLYAPQDGPTPVYRLVDEKTGEEITLPFKRRAWNGEELTICRFTSRYVVTDLNEPLLPSVVGAKIVKVQP